MTPFDYAAWVSRAHEFVARLVDVPHAEVQSASVAGAAREADLAAVERRLNSTIPWSLRAFFTHGAVAIDCRYVFEPDGEALDTLREIVPGQTLIYGGARLAHASELPDLSIAVDEWAGDTWVADDPDQRAVWEAALPFSRLDNGDYLALDLRSDASDPRVVYLNHDDESAVIAPSLDAFLSSWERLCYLGPEHWLLLGFTDPAGYLDPDSDRAARLRRLLDAAVSS